MVLRALLKIAAKLPLSVLHGIGAVMGWMVYWASPGYARRACEESLKRLQMDCIDLYYLHRWDKTVPIEDSVGEMSRMVERGWGRIVNVAGTAGWEPSNTAMAVAVVVSRMGRSLRGTGDRVIGFGGPAP